MHKTLIMLALQRNIYSVILVAFVLGVMLAACDPGMSSVWRWLWLLALPA